MSIVVTLNTVIGSRLAYGGFRGQQVVEFTATGLASGDLTSGYKSEALHAIKAAVLSQVTTEYGGITIPNHPELILSQIICEGFGDTSARGRLIYETMDFGGQPSVYIIRDSGTTVIEHTNMMPGTRIPFRFGWAPIVADVGKFDPVPPDSPMMAFKFPNRIISVSALIYGHPTSGQQYMRYANSAAWPTSPTSDDHPAFGIGYWLLTNYQTDYSRFSGYFQLDAAAESRVIEDWSYNSILRNHRTGQYVKVEDADMAALMAPAYDNTVTYGNGIMRVGPYPLIDFADIFGF
jgi:hypothetical protein